MTFKAMTLDFYDIDLAGGHSVLCAIDKRENEYIVLIRDGRGQDHAGYTVYVIPKADFDSLLKQLAVHTDGYIGENDEESIGYALISDNIFNTDRFKKSSAIID